MPASEMIRARRAWPYRGGLVVVVPTQVRDTGIQPAVQALPAVGGPVLAVCLSEPGDGLVDPPQFGQGVLQGFRVLSGGAVGQRGQHLDAHVDADRGTGTRRYRRNCGHTGPVEPKARASAPSP